MPGRALLTSGSEVPLDSIFQLNKSDVSSESYQAVIDGEITSFKVEGVITAESAWSLVEKKFDSSN